MIFFFRNRLVFLLLWTNYNILHTCITLVFGFRDSRTPYFKVSGRTFSVTAELQDIGYGFRSRSPTFTTSSSLFVQGQPVTVLIAPLDRMHWFFNGLPTHKCVYIVIIGKSFVFENLKGKVYRWFSFFLKVYLSCLLLRTSSFDVIKGPPVPWTCFPLYKTQGPILFTLVCFVRLRRYMLCLG